MKMQIPEEWKTWNKKHFFIVFRGISVVRKFLSWEWSFNTVAFSRDFKILISSISLFEITKVISFPVLTAPLSCIFLWISIAQADAIVANGANTFLAKGTTTFINGPANLSNKTMWHPPG